MSRRVSVDADLLGGLAACGTVGGAILGAKKGSHAGIVFGRKMGVKGTVVFGTIGALGGAVLGHLSGNPRSFNDRDESAILL